MHIALIGDSTFDNRLYTDGGLDVVREMLSSDRPAERPTHLALSVGGNDLLGEIDVLGAPARSVTDALLRVRERSERFGRAYQKGTAGLGSVGGRD